METKGQRTYKICKNVREKGYLVNNKERSRFSFQFEWQNPSKSAEFAGIMEMKGLHEQRTNNLLVRPHTSRAMKIQGRFPFDQKFRDFRSEME